MSEATEEMIKAFEAFDSHAKLRNFLRHAAEIKDRWAGIPMPVDDQTLVIEPRYPGAAELAALGACEHEEPPDPDAPKRAHVRNRFWSWHRRSWIIVFNKPDGSGIDWGLQPGVNHFTHDLKTIGASYAWGIEQEHAALQLLGTLVRHHTFKQYLLTGMLLEKSERSGVLYVFRKLRPTVAVREHEGRLKTLCCLCLHPIGYYAGSWAGVMTPTDDVVAHLMLMRANEPKLWARANHHPAWLPEAGL